MLRWLRNCWGRFRHTQAPTPAHRPPPPPGPVPPGAGGHPGVVDGVQTVRITTMDGVEVVELRQSAEAVTLQSGLVVESENRAPVVTIGDGTTVSSLEGLGTCQLCQLELMAHVTQGALEYQTARLRWLHHLDRLRITTTSGVCVCPLHRREIPGPDGKPMLVTTTELADLEYQAALQAPLQVLKNLSLERR